MTELGFKESRKLNFVFFHTCEGAATDKFAEALGIMPEDVIDFRIFIGWKDKVFVRNTASILFLSRNVYTKALWEFLASRNNLFDSKKEAEDACRDENYPNPQYISLLLGDYGILEEDIPSDQLVYFNYPDISIRP